MGIRQRKKYEEEQQLRHLPLSPLVQAWTLNTKEKLPLLRKRRRRRRRFLYRENTKLLLPQLQGLSPNWPQQKKVGVYFRAYQKDFMGSFLRTNTYVHVVALENREKRPRVVLPPREEREPETHAVPVAQVNFQILTQVFSFFPLCFFSVPFDKN